MIAIWFSGSPNQPPWLYRASEQPILPASSASGRSLAAAASTRRSCSAPSTRSGPRSSSTQSCGLDRVPLEHVEDDPRLAVQLAGRDPEGVERDAVPLEGVDLGVECRDVLGPPVVGEVLEAEPLRAWPRGPRAPASCCRTARCTRRSGCRARRDFPTRRSPSRSGRAELVQYSELEGIDAKTRGRDQEHESDSDDRSTSK